MQPSRQHCLYASLVSVMLLLPASRALADTLTITSTPSGATVEIDGQPVGPTPYKIEYPGGYFHKTHSVFGERLEHSMLLRVSKDGYLPQQITLTTGPFEWVGLTGHRHGTFFLLRSNNFKVRLEPVSVSGEFADTTRGAGPLPPYNGRKDAAQAGTGSDGITNNLHAAGGLTVNSGTVSIASDLAGADIYVDGKFVGQTPSTLLLAAGTHHVEVKSTDKKPWVRDLEVTGGSQLTLHAIPDTSP